jgi:hypothetical protein
MSILDTIIVVPKSLFAAKSGLLNEISSSHGGEYEVQICRL